ncbi:3-deoxy-manno-octulosonate cytidylyltransferase [Candidatus Pacearchaeota archaeon]|nr:3-deoxy-manno-octulosonate cytidylyltransferase [Candidatus Pacearchaeota archaeon]
MEKIVGIIPARHQSSRFPGKPLALLLGKPMILYVAEITAQALGEKNTFVATDDQRIADVVKNAGFNVIITSETALTGTDRVWEAATQVKADIYVNIQGDEPLLNPKDIKLIIAEKKKRTKGVVNGMCRLLPHEDPSSVNIPKVITTEKNRMVYMSRAVIPGFKSSHNKPEYYMKQVCIYAFTYEELEIFGRFGRKSTLEKYEDIEILRYLDLSTPVFMVETDGTSLAVDIPEDVHIVEEALLKRQEQ